MKTQSTMEKKIQCPQDRQKIDHKLFKKNVYDSQENTINRTKG